MLRSLLTRLWRRTTDKPMPGAFDGSLALQAEVRAAFVSLLHEPLAYPNTIDYEMVARFTAAASSADYMIKHMMAARNLVRRNELLEFALGECAIEGLVMEFGVYRGESLQAIAKRVEGQVHGFDSFEGLPEDWTYFQKKGRFSLQGETPEFDASNIRVHKGWFDQTLPPFLALNHGPARFIHVDCDLYTSARTVLELLRPRIVSGTVILFDEYLNYPAWQEHEFKAFQEFVAATGIAYRYVGFASSDCAVAVTIL
jgi:hypothetical protein